MTDKKRMESALLLLCLWIVPHVVVARRKMGENCLWGRSMRGACEFGPDGKELACLNIDGYFQCAPAHKLGETCTYDTCENGLACSSRGGQCRIAPRIGEFCSLPWFTANSCGHEGFCDDDGTCREFITSTVDREDPCPADHNHGYK